MHSDKEFAKQVCFSLPVLQRLLREGRKDDIDHIKSTKHQFIHEALKHAAQLNEHEDMQRILTSSESHTRAKYKCVVCLQNGANYAFLPCGHVCCCSPCATQLVERKCPMCRTEINSQVLLYFC
jgi:hypothetical protein